MGTGIEYVVGLVDQVSNPAGAAMGALSKLEESMGGAQGATEALDAVMPGLGEALGAAGAVALGLGAAVVGLTYAGAQLSIAAAEFKGDTLDALEALTGSADAAAETYEQINGLSKSLAQPREKVADLATELLNAGVHQGAQLEASITAASNLSQVVGDKGAGKLKSIIERSFAGNAFQVDARKLAGTGVKITDLYGAIGTRLHKSNAEVAALMKAGKIGVDVGVDALNETINKKLGGIAAKQLLDIGNQSNKFRDDISRLFEDVNTGPFLGALHEVLQVFDDATPSGKALKFVMTSIFDGVFKVASRVLPYVKTFLLQLVIVALRLYIAFKPVIKALGELFSSADDGALTFELKTCAEILFNVGYLVLLAVSAFVSLWSAGKAAFDAIGAGASAAVAFVQGLYASIAGLFTGGDTLAGNFVDGLVNGIKGGVGRAVEAAKGLATGALGAIKNTLGIASPSRATGQLAAHTVTGFVNEIESGTGDAQAAMAAMAAPPAASASTGGGGGGSGGGGGKSFSATINVNVAGGGGASSGNASSAEELAEIVAAKVADALEHFALQMGVTA